MMALSKRQMACFEAEEVFAEDPFDAEFRRREDEEAEEADRAIDDEQTGDFDVEN
jgi:hypothetical protein